MTVTTQRTLFGVDLALAQLFGANYETLPNTTLNEKFGILPGITVPPGSYPTLNYICIGVGGDAALDNSNNFVYNNHSPLDGALFKHIPFVMKKLDEDLSVADRAKYRFRKEEFHNSNTYACYYLKKIPSNLYDQKFFKVSNVNGESYLTTYDMNTPEILNPKPRTRELDINKMDSTEFITKLTRFKMELSSEELKELDNVYKVLDIGHRKLSEIGLCSGIEQTTGDIMEASCVQLLFHFGMNIDLTYTINTNSSFVKYIELGGAEALLN